MVVKQIRVNVSLSKNYNKVECESIIDIQENDYIPDVVAFTRDELIDYCKKGIDAIEPSETIPAQNKNMKDREEMATGKQQIALARAGYPGDPSKCSKSEAWLFLNNHKLPI